MYYDRDGNPIELMQWSKLFEDAEYKRVDLTWMMDAATGKTLHISTVWLGLDHAFGGGTPLIFETMVFAEGSWIDERCERYSTLDEARQGHTMMIIEIAVEMTDPVVMEKEPNT